MKQLMWIGVAWTTALVVLLLDERFYHMFAYPAYFAGLALLLGALLFGREVNGAKAWFEFGSFRLQPVEFVKIATALALARVMSAYSFSINRPGDLFKVGVVVCIPLFIIILQNDTGSGIVLGSFLFVLYREGLNKWLCIPVLLIAALFIVLPAFAHDAARVDHSGLHALRSDDDRGVALAPDLSGVAGAGEHPALHDDGARRARRDGPARLPADRDAAVAGRRARLCLPHEPEQHPDYRGAFFSAR